MRSEHHAGAPLACYTSTCAVQLTTHSTQKEQVSSQQQVQVGAHQEQVRFLNLVQPHAQRRSWCGHLTYIRYGTHAARCIQAYMVSVTLDTL